jgi:hypothetical protein
MDGEGRGDGLFCVQRPIAIWMDGWGQRNGIGQKCVSCLCGVCLAFFRLSALSALYLLWAFGHVTTMFLVLTVADCHRTASCFCNLCQMLAD